MRRSLLIAGAMAASLVWALAAGIVAARQWPATGTAIAHDRDTGVRGCTRRYSEPTARVRCEVLFETEYVMERNIALFTRLLVVLGPFAGVGAWAALGRGRPTASRTRRP